MLSSEWSENLQGAMRLRSIKLTSSAMQFTVAQAGSKHKTGLAHACMRQVQPPVCRLLTSACWCISTAHSAWGSGAPRAMHVQSPKCALLAGRHCNDESNRQHAATLLERLGAVPGCCRRNCSFGWRGQPDTVAAASRGGCVPQSLCVQCNHNITGGSSKLLQPRAGSGSATI